MPKLIEICKSYDSETDMEKRHLIGIQLDDLADRMTEKELKRAMRILKGLEEL